MRDVVNAAKWISRETGETSHYMPADAFVAKGATPGDERGDAVCGLVRAAMPDDGQEHLVAVAMDAHGVPLAYGRVATGSVDQCPLFARDVFAWALTVPCVRFVGVAHNHPSGDTTPSGPDGQGTALLAKVGQMLALDVVWSMVVTHEATPGAEWALVPIKGKAPEQGEQEPYQPHDPDEDEGEDSEGEGEDDPEGEPESDGTPNDEPEPDEGDEPSEEGEGEDPEGEDEAPSGDSDPDPDSDLPPAPAPDQRPTADVEALRAAVKAAFKLA